MYAPLERKTGLPSEQLPGVADVGADIGYFLGSLLMRCKYRKAGAGYLLNLIDDLPDRKGDTGTDIDDMDAIGNGKRSDD